MTENERKMIYLDDAINGAISIQRSNGVEIYSDKAVPVEYLINLPSVHPDVGTCKTCDCQKSCKHAQYLGNDGYCSRWERRTDEC